MYINYVSIHLDVISSINSALNLSPYADVITSYHIQHFIWAATGKVQTFPLEPREYSRIKCPSLV